MQTDKAGYREKRLSRRFSGAAVERLRDLGVSRREADVLALVLDPYSNAQIASRLGISKRTVESHISALLRKFGVPDRPALIRAGSRLINHPETPTATRQPDKPGIEKTSVVLHRGFVEFSRAAQLGRDSIDLHEVSAQRLEEAAARWRSQAMEAIDEQVRAHNLDRAAAAQQQAQTARSRAAEFRRRLNIRRAEPNR